MLKSLEFENFKSWGGRHRLDFGRITGLFGANSSGKSSIIHLLLLLKQTVESTDPASVLDFGSDTQGYFDFGGFEDIITNHDSQKSLSFDLHWTPISTDERRARSTIQEIVLSGIISASPAETRKEISVGNLKYRIECMLDADEHNEAEDSDSTIFGGIPALISIQTSLQSDGAYDLQLEISGFFEDFSEFDDGSTPIGFYRIHPSDLDVITQGLDLRDEEEIEGTGKNLVTTVSEYDIERVIQRAENHTNRLLERVIYLGPLRNFPKRDYRWTGAAPATVGHRGEQTIQVLLSDKTATVDGVSTWMRKLGLADSLSLKQVDSDGRIWEPIVEQQDEGPKVNIADVGFGLSQIMPVIVALLSAPAGALVILEHPDIHLHPRAQSALADLLIEVASTSDIQILVESHSEHLLARIQRRIAESARSDGDLAPEDVRGCISASKSEGSPSSRRWRCSRLGLSRTGRVTSLATCLLSGWR